MIYALEFVYLDVFIVNVITKFEWFELVNMANKQTWQSQLDDMLSVKFEEVKQ